MENHFIPEVGGKHLFDSHTSIFQLSEAQTTNVVTSLTQASDNADNTDINNIVVSRVSFTIMKLSDLYLLGNQRSTFLTSFQKPGAKTSDGEF